jgi:hypothetical protein
MKALIPKEMRKEVTKSVVSFRFSGSEKKDLALSNKLPSSAPPSSSSFPSPLFPLSDAKSGGKIMLEGGKGGRLPLPLLRLVMLLFGHRRPTAT